MEQVVASLPEHHGQLLVVVRHCFGNRKLLGKVHQPVNVLDGLVSLLQWSTCKMLQQGPTNVGCQQCHSTHSSASTYCRVMWCLFDKPCSTSTLLLNSSPHRQQTLQKGRKKWLKNHENFYKIQFHKLAYWSLQNSISEAGILVLTKLNFTSWNTGVYKIQFHKLANRSLQNSISQAGKQELTKFDFTSCNAEAYKIQFHKLANMSLQNSISQAGIQELTKLNFTSWQTGAYNNPTCRYRQQQVCRHMDRPSLGNTCLQGIQEQECSDTS